MTGNHKAYISFLKIHSKWCIHLSESYAIPTNLNLGLLLLLSHPIKFSKRKLRNLICKGLPPPLLDHYISASNWGVFSSQIQCIWEGGRREVDALDVCRLFICGFLSVAMLAANTITEMAALNLGDLLFLYLLFLAQSSNQSIKRCWKTSV